ncbi:MAG TPA: hypothetical protein VGD13_07435 [Xanthobacteraceae bacterium]
MVLVEKVNGVAAPLVYSRAMLEAKPLALSVLFEAAVRGTLDPTDLNLKLRRRSIRCSP